MKAITPNKQALRTVIAFAISTAGWVAFGLTLNASYREDADREALSQQNVRWRHAAGRAYTAYLKELGGGQPGVIRVPAGATVGCSKEASHQGCEPSLVYPPEGY